MENKVQVLLDFQGAAQSPFCTTFMQGPYVSDFCSDQQFDELKLSGIVQCIWQQKSKVLWAYWNVNQHNESTMQTSVFLSSWIIPSGMHTTSDNALQCVQILPSSCLYCFKTNNSELLLQ